MNNFIHVLLGVTGLLCFCSAFFTDSWLTQSVSLRLVLSLAMGVFFGIGLMNGVNEIGTASGAALFNLGSTMLGMLGCVRTLVSIEASAKTAKAHKQHL